MSDFRLNTINPADKAAIVSLSNGNLTFTVANNDATAGIYYLARSTAALSAGKWYWETTIFGAGATGATVYYTSAALLRADYALVSPNTSTYPGSTSVAVGGPFHMSDIKTYQNGVGSAALGSATPTGAGTTRLLRHKLDMDAGTYEQALDAGDFVTVGAGLTGTYYPALFFREGSSGAPDGFSASATINFGNSAFSYAIPPGFEPVGDLNVPTALGGTGQNAVMPLAITTPLGQPPVVFTYNPDDGTTSITGTVVERGVPINMPLSRRVNLIEQITGRVLREVWSDPLTGAYTFANILGGRKYTVVSYDHTGYHRAVIADNLEPT